MRLLHWLLAMCLAAYAVSTAQAAPAADNYQVQIHAVDMCCKGCVQKVSAQLYAAPGVTSVQANLDTRMIVVTVSQKKGASLEQLWQAVALGKGGPDQLTTSSATFTLVPATGDKLPVSTSHIAVENLAQEGKAQNIANQLYAVRGVQKVGVDPLHNTLVVTGEQLSPWALIGAVTNAKERPLSVVGSYGEMKIEWTSNQQASNHGGIQR